MRKTTTTTRTQKRSTAPTTTDTATPLSRGQVEEIVDEMLRTAFRDHARNIEEHLKSIHDRLVRIETHGALR
jgi:hypothetical protein